MQLEISKMYKYDLDLIIEFSLSDQSQYSVIGRNGPSPGQKKDTGKSWRLS
jgi:hypothetical protein